MHTKATDLPVALVDPENETAVTILDTCGRFFAFWYILNFEVGRFGSCNLHMHGYVDKMMHQWINGY